VKKNLILTIGPLLAITLMVSIAAAMQLSVPPLWLWAGLIVLGIIQGIVLHKQGFSVKGMMLAVVAYAPCTEDDPAFTKPGDCIEEGTGILGLMLVKKGFNISSAITDAITYAAAKTAEDIIPISGIEAYWPQTTQVTIPGLAGRVERHGYINYELPFKHEGVDANLGFWNNKNHKTDYGIVYITEEYKAFAPLDRQLEPVLVSIFAAPAGEQEFGKIRNVSGTVKWKHKDLVYLLDNLTVAILKPDFQV
jgi:hypothetical protein